ncbi:amidohydrolase [Actinomadura mexicana]|uniref:Amidohydrolase n=1 Tax=Actinomadura mexicana TaxID=134959 RepID=A0A239C9T9_9ACTN|nr:amidohydrolase [Actinomadura mexicana]
MPEPEQPDRTGDPANTDPASTDSASTDSASTDPASRPENRTASTNENITRRAPLGSAIAQGAHMTHSGPGVMPGLEPPAAPGQEGPEGREDRGAVSGAAGANGTAPGGPAPRDAEGPVQRRDASAAATGAHVVPGAPAVLGGAVLQPQLDAFLAGHEAELIAFRRDLHMHPELGYAEHRTTRRLAERLRAAGLEPVILPKGTGLFCDIGPADGTTVALRADIDALPLQDEKEGVAYRSTVPGVAHACGHDVHTAMVLGAGLFLAQQAEAGLLPGRVRLLFQPAEETPGGALDVMAAGGIAGVDRAFALHCDPRIEVGQLGLRTGPITAACDKVYVKVTGPGGHTARPHLTADLVYALAKIVTELPSALSRRVDPRSSLSLVWGRVSAGSVANAIPDDGIAEGTVRCLDDEAWHRAPEMMKALLQSVAAAYDVEASLDYVRGVPPTVNEAASVQMFRDAAAQVMDEDGVVPTPQSLGGEDFGWYLESIPGALARLGVRTPGSPGEYDLHRGDFDVDERCIAVGMKVLSATALTALWDGGRPGDAESIEGAALA